MKRALVSIVGLALITAACSGDDGGGTSTSLSPGTTAAATTTVAPASTSSVTPTTAAAVETTTTSTTTTSAPTTSTAGVFLSAQAMWEGEMQTITLYEDGTLVAGSAQGRADISSTDPYWIGEQAGISVVELGADGYARAILVEIPVAEEEDPPNVSQLFVVEGKVLRRVLNDSYGVYSVTALNLLGDGLIEYQEDGWTACGREDFPDQSNRQIVTLGFAGDEIAELGRRNSSDTQICDQLAG